VCERPFGPTIERIAVNELDLVRLAGPKRQINRVWWDEVRQSPDAWRAEPPEPWVPSAFECLDHRPAFTRPAGIRALVVEIGEGEEDGDVVRHEVTLFVPVAPLDDDLCIDRGFVRAQREPAMRRRTRVGSIGSRSEPDPHRASDEPEHDDRSERSLHTDLSAFDIRVGTAPSQKRW
jgi:hypothetical protein